MNKVEIYSKNWCGYCHMAKLLLDKYDVEYEEYDVTSDQAKESEMRERSGKRTVPQIFINNQSVGGFTDLAMLAQTGNLNELLQTRSVEDRTE